MIFITYDFYDTIFYDTHFRAQDTYSNNFCTLRDEFHKAIQTNLYVLIFYVKPHKI